MANKSYRNKPTRTKRNHTRKEKRDNLREVPSYVWADLKIENMPLGKCHLTLGEKRNK